MFVSLFDLKILVPGALGLKKKPGFPALHHGQALGSGTPSTSTDLFFEPGGGT
jgi:hypothetical protein